VIRATIGTWLSYATTVLFQILFASLFGTTNSAAAFVIAFALMGGISGVIVTTMQTVVSGRLLRMDSTMRSGALGMLGTMVALGGLLAVALALLAPSAGVVLARTSGYEPVPCTDLLRLAAAGVFIQSLSGALGVVTLVAGRRLLPAVSPALPTLCGAVAIVGSHHADVRWAFGFFVVGAALQVVVLGVSALNSLQVKSDPVPEILGTSVVTIGVLILLALLPPLERTVAALHVAQDAANYDYAIRSLRAVQQLVLGGVVLASLGDWAQLTTDGNRDRASESLLARVTLVSISLVLAASVAAVGSHKIVEIVYQRGAFNAQDTDDVTRILQVALPGFCAEGVGLVLISALAGSRHNYPLAGLGMLHFVGRVVLMIALAPPFGAYGVALGYSITQVMLLMPTLYLAISRSLWPRIRVMSLVPAVLVAGGTLTSALLLSAFANSVPALFNAAAVVGVCTLLFCWLRPVPILGFLAR
jgi:peptidoglycan biosynthesis protein MviN/MurJ (putative lipid II flippase)